MIPSLVTAFIHKQLNDKLWRKSSKADPGEILNIEATQIDTV